jgi:hypothetical protein
MFAFTLLALRCVNVFYSKRVKVVETIQPDGAVCFFSWAEVMGAVLEWGEVAVLVYTCQSRGLAWV